MNRILIIFPHGLGDAIMGTPAFRALRNKHPEARIDIAVQALVRHSGLLSHCPYFNSIYTIHNPWHSASFDAGLDIVRDQVNQILAVFKHDEVNWVLHKQSEANKIHKAFLTAKELNVDIDSSTRYEVFVSSDEERQADEWLRLHGFEEGNYCFAHTGSSDVRKNVSMRKLESMIPQPFRHKIVWIGKSYNISDYPIGFSIAILKRAGFTAMVDSVFVHCCDALKKDIDLHVSNQDILAICRPLHVKSTKVLEANFSKVANWQHRISKWYYRYFPWFNVRLRFFYNYLWQKLPIVKQEIRKWANEYLKIPPSSPRPVYYLMLLRVKFREHGYITKKPFLMIIKVDNAGRHIKGIVSCDPLPLLSPQLEISTQIGHTFTADTIEILAQYITALHEGKSFGWLAEYDVNNKRIMPSSIIDNVKIPELIKSREPFFSDNDVTTFFKLINYHLTDNR